MEHPAGPSGSDKDRIVYVLPQGGFPEAASDEIDLRQVWETLWNGRWHFSQSLD